MSKIVKQSLKNTHQKASHLSMQRAENEQSIGGNTLRGCNKITIYTTILTQDSACNFTLTILDSVVLGEKFALIPTSFT